MDAVIDSIVSSLTVVNSTDGVDVIIVVGDACSVVGAAVETSYSVVNIISVDELVPSGVKAFVVSIDDVVVTTVVIVVVDVVVVDVVVVDVVVF